jgi:dolichol-phosphate mannosyltransferase
VGSIGLVVNVITLALINRFTTLNLSLAVMFAVEASIISNFFLNNSVTFRKRRFTGTFSTLRGLLTFNAICVAGALINHSLALNLRQNQFGNIYFATMIGYAVATFWNYMINSHVCWKVEKS